MTEKKSFNHDIHWEVALDSFQGPLDLLLHLIDEYEIDIYDIPIAEITDQYLHYIQAMKSMELDIAGEYLVMAATLLQIKSEMLVPRNEGHSVDTDEYIEDDEDARDELVRMLLEYKRYKEIVPAFEERQADRQCYLTKEPSDLSEYQESIPLKSGELSLEDLSQAMNRALVRQQLAQPRLATIEADEKTVDQQIDFISKRVMQTETGQISFTDLLEYPSKSEIVVTFLAILELVKKNELKAFQSNKNDEIILKWSNQGEG